jgi:hypothetical protein
VRVLLIHPKSQRSTPFLARISEFQARMEPIAYDCIGCKKCWGADATIQLANHFEEVQIDSCACGDEHTGGASTVVTVSVIVRRLLPTFAFVPVGGGTVTEDFQGESAFDPASVNPPTPPGDIQTSPQHGVWQKTDWKTFAATLVAIQAENDAEHFISRFFRFDKLQFAGKLSESGDQIDLTLVFSHYGGYTRRF